MSNKLKRKRVFIGDFLSIYKSNAKKNIIVCPKKTTKKAVVRNKIKRQIREIIRKNVSFEKTFIVVYKYPEDTENAFSVFNQDWSKFLSRNNNFDKMKKKV